MGIKGALEDYRLHGGKVVRLEDGEAETVPTAGAAKFEVILDAGATVTISRVDALTAGAHRTGDTEDISTSTTTPREVRWPFYRVSVAGAGASIAFFAVTGESPRSGHFN